MKRTATKRTQPKPKTSKQGDYNELARMISGVLNHPLCPVRIYNSLSASVSDLLNSDSMDAPGTIACVLFYSAMDERQAAAK
jgi:hypothetical protein